MVPWDPVWLVMGSVVSRKVVLQGFPARGPPTGLGVLGQTHDDREVFQTSPEDQPLIHIHCL